MRHTGLTHRERRVTSTSDPMRVRHAYTRVQQEENKRNQEKGGVRQKKERENKERGVEKENYRLRRVDRRVFAGARGGERRPARGKGAEKGAPPPMPVLYETESAETRSNATQATGTASGKKAGPVKVRITVSRVV